MTYDVSFCMPHSLMNQAANPNPGMLATATGARVDIWKLQQKEAGQDDEDFDNQIEPVHSLRRFTEQVTAIKLRDDGQVMLVGDKAGQIQLIELNNKSALRTYNDHKNEINSLDFSVCRRKFVSCSNESSWKMYDI